MFGVVGRTRVLCSLNVGDRLGVLARPSHHEVRRAQFAPRQLSESVGSVGAVELG